MGNLSVELAAAALSFFLLFLITAYGEKISNAEYLAFKRQLRTLNRPGVAVIKTKYGDIYDCVDIHKQPSLDHPLLKNHTLQMAPSYLPEAPKKDAPESGFISLNASHLDGGTCPEGTVPLKRLTVEDLITGRAMRRMKRKRFLQQASNISTNDIDGFNHHHAWVKAEGGRYFGFSAKVNAWNPGTVYYTDSSTALITVFSGPLTHLNVLEVGWHVLPRKHKSRNVHLFTYWTSESYHNGCYDRECQGFVQTSSTILVPSVISPLSIYEGLQYHITLQLYKDRQTSHWWLIYGEDPDRYLVGYWPSNLFPYLAQNANAVQWGGEVSAICTTFPPMGSGHFATEDYRKACYMKDLMMVNPSGGLVDLPPYTQGSMSDITCYTVIQYLPGDTDMGRHIFFGGPGGRCRSPC